MLFAPADASMVTARRAVSAARTWRTISCTFFQCPILINAVKKCLYRLRWAYLDPICSTGLNTKLLTFCLPSCGLAHDCSIILLVDAILSTHIKLRCNGGAEEDRISSLLQARIMSWARTSSFILKVVNGG